MINSLTGLRYITAYIAACRNARADVAFVLDASGSIVYDKPNSTINLTNWNLMKDFVITLIRSLRVSQTETRVALVRFSHESSVVFQLDSYSTAEEAVQVNDFYAVRQHIVYNVQIDIKYVKLL